MGDWSRAFSVMGDERVVGVLESDGEGIDVVQEHLYVWDGGLYVGERG